MSDVYRQPAADAPSTGERLWSRSARGSILAVVFLVVTPLLGVRLYVSDPRNTPPLLCFLGAFSLAVLVGWVLSSHNAIVAIFERGLRVGWLGGRTHFVPWEEVTRVEDRVARSRTQYNTTLTTETARVHCRGEVYSVSDRFIGGKSFRAALEKLRAHVRPECFQHTATGFDPPSRVRVAVAATLLWLSALWLLVVAAGHVWSLRGAVEPNDPSHGAALHALSGDFESLGTSLVRCAPSAAVIVAVLWLRARRERKRRLAPGRT